MTKLSFAAYREKVHTTKSARMEVDTIYWLERHISVWLSYILIRLWPQILPTYVSVANVLLVLLVLVLNLGKPTGSIIGLTLVQLFLLRLATIGDKVDGEIARYRAYFTQAGIYFDLAFHFFYPFVFIFSIGYTFSLILNNPPLTIAVVVVAILMVHYRLLGKLRHHIRFKIQLENHGGVLRDYREKNIRSVAWPASFRFIRYLLFFIYDWTWFFYLLLILGLTFSPYAMAVIYCFYLAVLAFALLLQIFVIYPKHYLFSVDDFS
ncbi:MAG: hypothetical protein A2571_01490 [Candidatus Vogelbacteria bacterium RIFOXYD1_FULL_44_32]|uniref:CDP-alcohol phosphatidyltransferase n=1 Tax=Candidatus Vogelbacteria bacterium RIFOXYD1_FULL_44_32 TaxID=1802438 RepID=A0A1G2QCX5_9BACT|nr:MAG: hypothetical protein A2571_01490 [Candidatus Vogelbacteria bacterium RIFOXYD1_FULL_44_32]